MRHVHRAPSSSVVPRIRFCGLIFLVSYGCTPPAAVQSDECITAPPETVIIKRLSCTSEQIPGGEGVPGDWLVTTPTYRAVIRNPIAALTVAGLQGGTLIDLAPWGRADRLHELFPLQKGQWMDTEEVVVIEDTLILKGTPRAWPDQPSDTSETTIERIWKFSEDPPHISISGHEDIWLHGQGRLAWHGDRWISPNLTVYLNGTESVDSGGSVLHRNATTLTVRDNATPFSYDVDSETRVSGQAIGAIALEFWSNQALLGRLQLSSDTFATPIPNGTEQIRAIGAQGATSEFMPPTSEMNLTLVSAREVDVQFQWPDARAWPVGIQWFEGNDETLTTLPPTGGTLYIPHSVNEIHIGRWPRIVPQTRTLSEQEDDVWTIPIETPYFPSEQKWIQLNGQGDRSKRWRGPSSKAKEALIAEGFEWAVISPEYDIGLLEEENNEDSPTLWRAGSQSPHPEAWSILSWPWVEKSRLSGRGVSPIATLGPIDALASISAGPGARRFTAATPNWFLNPETLDGTTNQNHPDYIWVDEAMNTDTPLVHLQGWFEHLNAQRFIPPVGDKNWVPVQEAQLWNGADIEAALLDGKGTASNGPLLHVDINQTGPGGTVDTSRLFNLGWIDVSIGVDGAVPETLWIISDGVSKEIPLQANRQTFQIRPPRQWMTVVAWSPQNGPWAVTAPIWFESRPSAQ